MARKGKKRNTNKEVHLEVIRSTDYRDFIWRLATRAAIELRNGSIRTAISKKRIEEDIVGPQKEVVNFLSTLSAYTQDAPFYSPDHVAYIETLCECLWTPVRTQCILAC
jgi:hypothetical protein